MPYDAGNCGQRPNEFVQVGACQNGAIHPAGTNLFPDKVPRDLNRCPMRVVTNAKPPYILFPFNVTMGNLRDDIPNAHITDGFEVKLLNTIAEYMNMRTEF